MLRFSFAAILALDTTLALTEGTASAGAYTAVTSGNCTGPAPIGCWCDPATWGSATHYPGDTAPGDTVSIPVGTAVAVTGCFVPNSIAGISNAGSLTIAAASQLALAGTGSFGGTGSLATSGTGVFVVGSSAYNMTGGTFSMTGGSIIGVSGGSFTLNPGVTATIDTTAASSGIGGIAFTTQVPITYNPSAGHGFRERVEVSLSW